MNYSQNTSTQYEHNLTQGLFKMHQNMNLKLKRHTTESIKQVTNQKIFTGIALNVTAIFMLKRDSLE